MGWQERPVFIFLFSTYWAHSSSYPLYIWEIEIWESAHHRVIYQAAVSLHLPTFSEDHDVRPGHDHSLRTGRA